MELRTHSNFLRKDSRRAYELLIVLQNKKKTNFKTRSVPKERNPKKRGTLAPLNLRCDSFWFRSREPRTRFGFRSWEPKTRGRFRSQESGTRFRFRVPENETHSNFLRIDSRSAYERLIVLQNPKKTILRRVPFPKNGILTPLIIWAFEKSLVFICWDLLRIRLHLWEEKQVIWNTQIENLRSVYLNSSLRSYRTKATRTDDEDGRIKLYESILDKSSNNFY